MTKKQSIGKRIGRYFIEILIIIIGITLSFTLNEWNKKQSDQSDYYDYLRSLKQDIKIDSLQMANDIRSYRNISRGTGIILRYDDKYRTEPDSFLNFALAVDRLTSFIEFLPNNNTFQMLSSTGGFRVFEDKELVKEIIQLYQYDYAYIQMMGKETHNEREHLLEPYLVKNIYFEDKETFPEVKTDIPKLIKDPMFRNLCYSYGSSCWSAINSYRRAIKRLNKVEAKIDQILKSE